MNLYSNIRKVTCHPSVYFCIVIENYYFWHRLAFCNGIFSCEVRYCPCDGVCIVIEEYSSSVIGRLLVLYVAHKEHLCCDTLVAALKAIDISTPTLFLYFL